MGARAGAATRFTREREINLVQTAAHAGKIYRSTHNLLKSEHRSASILVSYPHGMGVVDNASLFR